VLIRRSGEQITGINRLGLIIALPQNLTSAAGQIRSQQWTIDGEAVGETFHAFDILASACVGLTKQPYQTRLKELEKILPAQGPIRLVPTPKTTSAKRHMLADLHARRAECIVFKRHAAVYYVDRPNSGGDQLKYKFVCSASCIVAGVNGNKRSAKMELIDGGQRVTIGNVTIPANHAIPIAGQVAEIRYLYAYPGGSLYQPVYLGLRDDLAAAECKVSQLKFKPDGLDTDNDAKTDI
jgi:bifunctional non-homologous end joining protein LigD